MSWCTHETTRSRWAKKEGKNVGAFYCLNCDCFLRWMNNAEFEAFKATHFAKKAKKPSSQQRMF